MPNKKILVIQYSQSGQLNQVVEAFIGPLVASADIDVKVANLEPESPYPYPWPVLSFFNVFPECIYQDTPRLKPLDVDPDEEFDLVILAYQVWFLSPSLPTTAFLKSDEGKRLLRDKPVITLIGCRNMWVMAQQAVSKLLTEIGARLIDNVVLVDQGSTLASFITTPRWLLTGKKNAFWGFPEAGIAQSEIKASSRFGIALNEALAQDKEQQQVALLSGLQAVKVDVGLLQSEKAGYRSFLIWGKLLRKIGNQDNQLRKFVLVFYICFLIVLILTVVPVSMLLKSILQPLFKKKYQSIRQQYELPSGSGNNRMKDFT